MTVYGEQLLDSYRLAQYVAQAAQQRQQPAHADLVRSIAMRTILVKVIADIIGGCFFISTA